jgi:ribosomal protein L11 methyltransferase
VSDALVRVSLSAPLARAEEARAAVLELAPEGFEEAQHDDAITFGLYVDAERVLAIRAAFGDTRVDPVAPGWEDAWRAFHRPVRAGGVWIGPPWELPPAGAPVVVIDPGRAFGTGAHPTTRLCVELLATAPRGSLLDVGCGSGVLAIAAARLGYGPLAAIDDDPVAVEVTGANALANGVEVETAVVDAAAGPLPQAHLAVANILLGAVESVLPRLRTRFAITSGYLAGERPEASGWSWMECRELDGWAADLFARESV